MTLITVGPTLLSSNAGAEVFFRWKEFMKSLGWTVHGSGDGSTNVSLTGDIITGFANAPNGVSNRAWIRLRDPDGVAEITQQAVTGVDAGNPAQQITSRCKYSPLARFSGGGASFNTTPPATDEFVVRGGPVDGPTPLGRSSYGGENITSLDVGGGADKQPNFMGMGETTFPFRFWFSKLVFVSPPSISQGHVREDGWLYDLCQGAQNPTLDDPNQMFLTMGANQGGGINTLGTADGNWLNSNVPDTTTESQGAARLATSGPLQIVRCSGPNNQSLVAPSPWLVTAHDLVPAIVNHRDGEPGTVGIKGVLSWVRGVMQDDSETETEGTAYTVDGVDYAYLRFNTTALPWNGVVPSDGTWTNLLPAILWNQVTDQDLPGGSGVLVYRMRAFDGGLGRLVYWSAPKPDAAGDFYTGPGPLSLVNASNKFTQTMI